MQAFLDACQGGAAASRLTGTLRAIVSNPALHARFLNSLSRLEYVGVRKMLKARQSRDIDVEGLQHLLEEAVHATRLKKFARAVAPAGVCVDTFRAEHTLSGDEAESYFQSVDRATAELLREADPDACYTLTSAAIEIRARCFYPVYQELLQASGSRVSVASILTDEEAHLQEMQQRLAASLPEWRQQLERVMQVEERAFHGLLDALDSAIADSAIADSAIRGGAAR